jgi:hypothetical protein
MFQKNMLPLSSRLKLIGSEIGLVILGSYKEDGHEIQKEDIKKRNLVLSSGNKLTKMDIKWPLQGAYWFIVKVGKWNSEIELSLFRATVSFPHK